MSTKTIAIFRASKVCGGNKRQIGRSLEQNGSTFYCWFGWNGRHREDHIKQTIL
jgi:hypothetical protein